MASEATFASDTDASSEANETHYDYHYYYDDEDWPWLEDVRTLWQVSGPILLTVGTIANVMTILIMRRVVSSATAFPLLFMALAVTDLLLLYLSLLPRWIGEQFGHWLTDKNEASCKALSWLEYSFTSLSAWLLSAMTAQRAVSIVWPARSRAVSAWKQAALTTVVLTVASFAFNSSVLYGMTKQESCWWEYHFQRNALHVLQLVEIFLNSIIPSLVMVVCNCFMIRAVMLSADHRPSSGEDPQAGLAPSRVTLTLIVVSLVFIVLTLPMYVTQIVLRGNSELDGHGPFQIWYNVTSVMWITNSVVNFFLYVMTSPRFREEGKRLLGKARPTSDHAGSGTETEMARLNTTLV